MADLEVMFDGIAQQAKADAPAPAMPVGVIAVTTTCRSKLTGPGRWCPGRAVILGIERRR